VLIQFEDFANHSAFRLPANIATRLASSTTTSRARGGCTRRTVSALRTTGGKLRDQTILFLGAGGLHGIADLVVSAMMAEGTSKPTRCGAPGWWNSRGLVVKDRPGLSGHKLRYAHEQAPIGDFLTAINTLKPTAIIGVAAVGGAFTPEVLQTMAKLNTQPIVFALSNPTSKAECSAEEAYRHTEGRVLFACGSPFDPVKLNGTTFVPRQGQQLLHLPRRGIGRDRQRQQARHRRDVHGAAHTLANFRQRGRSQAGQSLSRAAADPRGLRADRRGGRRRRLAARPRRRAAGPTTPSASSNRRCTTRIIETPPVSSPRERRSSTPWLLDESRMPLGYWMPAFAEHDSGGDVTHRSRDTNVRVLQESITLEIKRRRSTGCTSRTRGQHMQEKRRRHAETSAFPAQWF